MHGFFKRRQAGQAIVLVAASVLVLTAILMLAIDGGGIYLERRQLQNAADSAALAGAEKLWSATSPNYLNMHNQALATLGKNLNVSTAGISPANSSSGGSPWSIAPNYRVTVQATSYSYQVTIQHTHSVVVAPIHGFASTMQLQVQATAQNENLPYAIVLLQDRPQYAQWSNFNINGSPGGVTLNGGGGVDDRGGIFSNASISAGNGNGTITFNPAGGAGDLWAVNESASDLGSLTPAKVTGYLTPNPPRQAVHLDFPNYPMPAPPASFYNGSTVVNGTSYLCPGQYTNQITVQNGATAVLFPGVYEVQANGVSIQGTLRTLDDTDGAAYPLTCGSLTLNGKPADTGVIIEVRPDNAAGTTTCNKHIFSAAANSNITLVPSSKYFNINLYIETMPNWQTTCNNAPLGTNVVRFSGGACYSIGGIIYGPADNMVLTGSGCGTGVGQVVAWTLTINGNGNVNETFDPDSLPYMKGLIQ